MSTVHHETALAFLSDANKQKPGAAELHQAIGAAYPGWGTSAIPAHGYGDQHFHVSTIVARSLHDTMPAPKTPYKWDHQHGFADVMRYLDSGEPDDKTVLDWLGGAVDRLKLVMADN
ncbi:MAG: hypothetical protein Rhirs2KO_18520 [Rhizobiaceae bacterium]